MGKTLPLYVVSETRDYTTLTVSVPQNVGFESKVAFCEKGEIRIWSSESAHFAPVRIRFKPSKALRVVLIAEPERKARPAHNAREEGQE